MAAGGRRVVFLLLCGFVTVHGTLAAQTHQPSEHEVKAAFVYNFAKFVTWPDDAFTTADDPIIIGVLGDDPFCDVLDKTVEGKVVAGRPLVVRRWNNADSLPMCHILFVGASSAAKFSGQLEQLVAHHTLTVGEWEDFAELGGIIGFVMSKKKVRFEVNQSAADKARLKVSSKLLAVATAIKKE